MAHRDGGVERDFHHLLFTRKTWTSFDQVEMLRTQTSLIPHMDRDTHEALHRDVTTVPLPDYYMAMRALRNYIPGSTIGQSMDNLLFSFDEAIKYPKARSLDKRLGRLTMEAIEQQRAYIVGGSDPTIIDLGAYRRNKAA